MLNNLLNILEEDIREYGFWLKTWECYLVYIMYNVHSFQ